MFFGVLFFSSSSSSFPLQFGSLFITHKHTAMSMKKRNKEAKEDEEERNKKL
jgi:hypothetical protein